MPAQKGFSQLIVFVILALGLIGFLIFSRQDNSSTVPENRQEQPQQSKNSNNQPQRGYGFKQPFYQKDGISLQHYWPGEGSFSAEETEILLLNEGGFDLQVKSFEMSYTVEGKAYPEKSGTWEKFPSKTSWNRMEYINISTQYYKEEPLILIPGQKGKLHWHIQFGSNPLDGKQTTTINLTLLKDGKSIPIKQTLIRDSGMVVSKGDH